MSLDAFFEAMAPMLERKAPAKAVVETLGPTPSALTDLGFYATLVERNHFKILSDMFPELLALVQRELPERWPALVRSYRDAHPAVHWDPNRFAAGFSDFLRGLRDAGDIPHPIYEELADLGYIRQVVYSGNGSDANTYEGRIAVRQYTHPASDFFFKLREDPSAPIPQPRPQVVFVYRHVRDDSLHHFLPTAAGLAALARRRGIDELPAMFSSLSEAQIAEADRSLVEWGVLAPRET